MISRRLFAAVGVAALALAAQPAAAAWPERTIRIVVPFAAGGTTDIVARLVAEHLTGALGQQVIVDNKPGAGGNIGSDIVAKSAPDGYTLLMGAVSPLAINPSLYAAMPFDPTRDFDAVVLAAAVPNVMVVNPKVPATTVVEFLAHVRANPGKVPYASSGAGTSIHLSAEMFKVATKTDMPHVPYRGSGPALNDLVAGHVVVMFDNLPSSIGHIKAGSLRALAVTSTQRSPALPDVPTLAESGLPGFEATSWFGIVAPKGTPQPIIAQVNAEVRKYLATDAAKTRFADLGADRGGGTPAEFAAFMAKERTRWAEAVAASGAKVN